MAGPSSKVDHVYIGAIEISSHPKIKPEIQVIEPIGDSNDICGLKSKECEEIMEHLKNNPGLVVKSLGPEGQTLLHVAVMANETKKPKTLASKDTDKGFSKAAIDSDWYCALERPNCKKLMELLQENPCLVAQTGPERQTVLHIAAKTGCFPLLDQVHDLFINKEHFVDNKSGVKVSWEDLVTAKCGIFEAEAWHMAWFTCPRIVFRALKNHLNLNESFSSYERRYSSNEFPHLREKLVQIMQGEPSKQAFEHLERCYRDNSNDIFFLNLLKREELRFHHACKVVNLGGGPYVKTIIDGCIDLGPDESVEVLKYLFQLHNAKGQTPVHVTASSSGISELLKLVPQGDAYKECLNAKDARGWTTLHYVTATKNYNVLEVLLKDERVDVNARTSFVEVGGIDESVESGLTALHLAILHNDVKSVELLLQCPHTDVNALLYRYIVCGYKRTKHGDIKSYWSPLQLASIMGLSNVVRALLDSSKDNSKFWYIYDDGKLQNNSIKGKDLRKMSALILACASGNPDTLRLFLDNPRFDPLVKFEGATALHYATYAMIPMVEPTFFQMTTSFKIGHFFSFSDLGCLDLNIHRYEEEPRDTKFTLTSCLRRQACTTMLLQAGVDIWEKDDEGKLAGPGPQAPEEIHLWWHDQMSRETLEAKKSLNDAANAISVVAALVATASFVGPLQPPLGYEEDSREGGIQDTHLSVRVFMVSNILSFYLAVASILFAVVPSLPMPQEGIYAEWQRTRRTVGVAIFFLLMSVLGVLITFGAASNSVVFEAYSWRHVGLSFYPTIVGGLICILGITLFFLRLLRLVFNRNDRIRYLYKKFVKF